MELNDIYLRAVAATAIGLIGFASLIGVFRRNQETARSSPETTGLHLIVEHSLAALFLSLPPFVLRQYRCLADWTVRITSFIATGFFARQLWMVRARLRRGVKARRPGAFYTQFIPLTVFFLLLQFYNAIKANQPGHFCLGLLWLLTASGWQFLHFVFPAERSP